MQTARSRFIAAAFDHGQVPSIACFNKATGSLGGDFGRLITVGGGGAWGAGDYVVAFWLATVTKP